MEETPTSTTTAPEEPSRIRRRPSKRVVIVAGVLLGLVLLAAAGVAYAGYDYSRRYEGRILPGAAVAGVDIGGMTRAEAIEAVRAAVRPQLEREVTIEWKKRSWTVTPKELGAQSNARSIVDQALAYSGRATFIDKTRMSLFDDELEFSEDVGISYPRKGAKGFIEGLASGLNREPRDAELDYSTGWVEIIEERSGRKVAVRPSLNALQAALTGGSDRAELKLRVIEPAVTSDAYDEVLLVRIGENKLYYYQDGKITHEWIVGTGLPEYPTPTGLYEVTELRYMPTWVNPAPDGWGADMPASIPPGPSNPLGLRAINWSAPAIRFHGTSATYSLGYNASHGCVRMSNEDVIELYDMVEVGTPIVSYHTGVWKPLYTSSSGPQAENSADAVEESGSGNKKKND